VACKREMRNAYKIFGIRIYSYKILVEKLEGNKSMCRWEDNIQFNLFHPRIIIHDMGQVKINT
jgi:hypothetical protein